MLCCSALPRPCSRVPTSFRFLPTLAALLLPFGAFAGDGPPPDPFATEALARSSQAGTLPCAAPVAGRALSLEDVVERALCANPQTREAWANARYQAAQLGVAKSAWLPSVSATVTDNRLHGSGSATIPGDYSQASLGLSASWLLWDFGARSASVESAAQLLAAANLAQDATVQTVFLSAVQAWCGWFAAQGAVAAALESEKASQESLKAAERRYEVGTATPADKLQARTAWSQAVLVRIKAQGEAKSSRGVLMNVLGLDASDTLAIAAPGSLRPAGEFAADLARLIERAKLARSDLAASTAQVQAAKAGVDLARANGLPTVTLGASAGESHSSLVNPGRSSSIGVTVSIPVFTGFSTAYKLRAAQAQVAVKAAQRERIERQVSLDVWKAYHGLVTATQSLLASADLLASAEQSRRVAKGRFDAGVGGILDLLNAESALASARQQDVQTRYDWLVAKFSLAQSIGVLSLADVQKPESIPAYPADKK